MEVIAYLAGMFILFGGVFKWAIKYDKKLRQPIQISNGVSATGIILDFHKSRGRFSQPADGLDNVYCMLIRIHVTAENGDSWMTKTREYVHESQFNMFRIGDTIHLKYDPENINNVRVHGEVHLPYQPEPQVGW